MSAPDSRFIGVAPCAGDTDRTGPASARPVFLRPTGDDGSRQFQSDDDFATLRRWLTRAQIGIAITAVLWIVLPALLMWLAGGTPA